MDRKFYLDLIGGDGSKDYEIYLRTKELLRLQKPFNELCNGDELQFQVIHQVAELWMKLLAYTLLDVNALIEENKGLEAANLLSRAHKLERLLIDQLELLNTMSPKSYQEIRVQLGNGSGQESPGFRLLLKLIPQLWPTYRKTYLETSGRSLDAIYDIDFKRDDAFLVAEGLLELDALFMRFRFHHYQLVQRTIGLQSKSLKGKPVEILESGHRQESFPELWAVRSNMTDRWGGQYGEVRGTLKGFH